MLRLHKTSVVFARTALTLISVLPWNLGNHTHATAQTETIAGQLILPDGDGSRGVEIIATISRKGEAEPQWILFDDQGHFTHSFDGSLTHLELSAGIDATIRNFENTAVPPATDNGKIDFGTIDLRDLVQRHRLRIRTRGEPGQVRVAMWGGPPPPGVP